MSHLDCQWSLSNPGPEKLLVWLEPWAEEFEVPDRSMIALCASGETEEDVLDEVEWTSEHLVLWAHAGGTVKVFVDGALQESASALIPSPEGLTKKMLDLAFGGQPAARLGGQAFDVIEKASWWQRARRRLGL